MTKSDFFKANIEALNIFKENDTMLSVEQCGDFLKAHPNTIKSRIEKERIKAVFQGGKYHIPKIQFLEKLTTDLDMSTPVKLLVIDNVKAFTVFNANATIFTVEGCANYLQVHARTIKNRIKTDTITSITKSGKFYIPKLQFLESLTYSFEHDMLEAS
ncbi:hypothetical protein EV195_11256 [Tenacibaculum skagerrakense]|uniref:Uncharacterized protein n=1 Tax=Tenacibaculum skagerrakense TaxID=186571 RepID=A0A4R2NLH5_9FLAO|nr:hypothetical protein [Tenacibaculum skagerrakense]TCP22407.1 hypothetical protein EV195_11256 [Tenacibaculum skagerrakense]